MQIPINPFVFVPHLCYVIRCPTEVVMAKEATIRARIEPDLKRRVESVLGKLGLSTTEAITLFYRQVDLRKGLPFNVVIPNKTTLKTMEDTEADRNLVLCKDANDLFKKLGI